MSGPGTETKVNQVYKDQNFQAIGLDWYPNSNEKNVRDYQQLTKVTYPLCIDAVAERATYQAYEANDVSLVIDQSGIVRYRGAGVKVDQITSWIDNLLVTSVAGENNIPEKPHLYQNYPNPFNPVTNIIFEIKESQKVILQIYNIEGRLIKTLIENQLYAGRHELSWNGLNSRGNLVASGVYYYVLRAGDYQSAKRMVLMR